MIATRVIAIDEIHPAMKTVNLKTDLPSVHEALQRLERELNAARLQGIKLLKIVHGYGSSGVGGDIRIAVQKRLCEMTEGDQIRGYIFGENWARSDAMSWKLVRENSELKKDSDLGRRNQGITIVIL